MTATISPKHRSPAMSFFQSFITQPLTRDVLAAKDLAAKHPSKVKARYSHDGLYKEYAGYKTAPQQDHRSYGNAIAIAAPIDNRATPWNEVVRANMHSKPVTALPRADATRKEVREWLYFIMSNDKWSCIPDTIPQEVNSVINHWRGTGAELRTVQQLPRGKLCPETWTSVYHEVYDIKESHRDKIENYIKDTVSRLLIIEWKSEMKKQQEEKEREEEEKIAEKIDLYTLETKKSKPKKRSIWRRILCSGKEEVDDCDAESVDTLPRYVERIEEKI